MLKIFTCLLPLSNGKAEENKLKQLIKMYQDDFDCSQLGAIGRDKTLTKKCPQRS